MTCAAVVLAPVECAGCGLYRGRWWASPDGVPGELDPVPGCSGIWCSGEWFCSDECHSYGHEVPTIPWDGGLRLELVFREGTCTELGCTS